MTSNKSEILRCLDELDDAEKSILYAMGKMRITVNKNVREETIRKKLPDKYLINFDKALSNLIKRGIVVRYRPHNYGLSQKGRIWSMKWLIRREKIFIMELEY